MKKLTSKLLHGKLSIYLLAALFLYPQSSYAISENQQQNIINQQNQIIQNQQQFEREKERQKELKEIKKEQQKIEDEEKYILEENDGKIVHDLRAIQCFRVNKIIFSENKIFSKWREKLLTKKYLGQCLSIDQLSEIGKEISNYLVENGYITSHVEVPQQSLSSGILKITIIESYLEKIIFNEDKFLDKTQKFTAFGFSNKKDEILNLHKIEQGVDQINRLQSNNASVKLFPGSGSGSSIVAIENHPIKTTRANISYDNNGNEVTGSKREAIAFSQDNLLHLNDNFNISRTSNDFDKNRDKGRSTSFSSSFSIPFKQHNLAISYLKSSYFFITGDGEQPIPVYGITSTRSVSLDSILIKNKKFKTSSNFTLSSRYNRNFNNDEKQYVSSRKASIFSTSIANTIFFNNAALFLKPAYNRTINILDSQKDLNSLASNEAHGEFDIFKFYGNYNKRFQIPYLKTPISYNISFDSQASQQTLNGNDKFSVGGVYSVRGFKNGSISGDSGYNIKNELGVNLGQAVLPYVNVENPSKYLSYLNYFTVTPFYDYGFVRAKGGEQSGRVSGGGFKTSFNHKNINASLTFSYAISKSQLLLQNRDENSAVYFDIATEFGFF